MTLSKRQLAAIWMKRSGAYNYAEFYPSQEGPKWLGSRKEFESKLLPPGAVISRVASDKLRVPTIGVLELVEEPKIVTPFSKVDEAPQFFPPIMDILTQRQREAAKARSVEKMSVWREGRVPFRDQLMVARSKLEDQYGVPQIDRHTITWVEPGSKNAKRRSVYGEARATSIVEDLKNRGVEEIDWDAVIVPKDKKYVPRRLEEFKSLLKTKVPFRMPEQFVLD